MKKILFIIEESPEGGFTAKASGESIFTEAETTEQLWVNIKDAVECHFEADKMPDFIKLHI